MSSKEEVRTIVRTCMSGKEEVRTIVRTCFV